jgi:1-phosphatidylinositol phosphodiesterase
MVQAKHLLRCTGLVLLSLLGLPAAAHNDSGYYHDKQSLPAQGDWMLALNNQQPLSTLSLPGTHDSGATKGGPAAATQTLSIRQQLDAGIRFLDIRLRAKGDVFAIHHGFVFQELMFDDVLDDVREFLAQHPGETVLMRVKDEYKAESGSQPFVDIFRGYFARYRELIAVPDSLNVPLSEVRGKVVFLTDFAGGTGFGLAHSPATFTIQDDYKQSSVWGLYSKWTKVRSQFELANNTPKQMHINYLSATGGSFPYFFASGHIDSRTNASRLPTGVMSWNKGLYPDLPRVSCVLGVCNIVFEGINILAKNYLNGPKALTQVGIVVADFPGAGLIQSVIEVNTRQAAQGGWQRQAGGR